MNTTTARRSTSPQAAPQASRVRSTGSQRATPEAIILNSIRTLLRSPYIFTFLIKQARDVRDALVRRFPHLREHLTDAKFRQDARERQNRVEQLQSEFDTENTAAAVEPNEAEITSLTNHFIECDRVQWAREVETARAVFMKHPDLVTAPEYPADLIDALRSDQDPNYTPSTRCWTGFAEPENVAHHRESAIECLHERRYTHPIRHAASVTDAISAA